MGRERKKDETKKEALRGANDALCDFDVSSVKVKTGRERETRASFNSMITSISRAHYHNGIDLFNFISIILRRSAFGLIVFFFLITLFVHLSLDIKVKQGFELKSSSEVRTLRIRWQANRETSELALTICHLC